MRIITLLQPWAGAVVFGEIDGINARYATNHRSDMLIHAGKLAHYFPRHAPPCTSDPLHFEVSRYSSVDDAGMKLGVVEIAGVTAADECQLP